MGPRTIDCTLPAPTSTRSNCLGLGRPGERWPRAPNAHGCNVRACTCVIVCCVCFSFAKLRKTTTRNGPLDTIACVHVEHQQHTHIHTIWRLCYGDVLAIRFGKGSTPQRHGHYPNREQFGPAKTVPGLFGYYDNIYHELCVLVWNSEGFWWRMNAISHTMRDF